MGAFAANLFAGAPFFPSLFIAFGNSSEAILGALIFKRIYSMRAKLEELTFVSGLTLTSLLAPIFSASVGVGTLVSFGLAKPESATMLWFTWWIGDSLGVFLFLPFINIGNTHERSHLISLFSKPGFKNVAVVLGSILCVLGAYTLLKNPFSLKFLFLAFAAVFVFSAFQNRIFLFLNVFLLSSVVVFITINGVGPFSSSTTNQNLLHLGIFLCTLMVISAGMAAYFRTRFIKVIQTTMFVGLAFWGVIFFKIQNSNLKMDQNRIATSIDEGSTHINSAFKTYVGTLTGGAALFMASKSVEFDEWRDYADHLNKYYELPGVSGLGVVNKVSRDNLVNFTNKYRKEMDKDFEVKYLPQTSQSEFEKMDDHYIITYIEPFENNRPARGLDLASEKIRAKAARSSMLTGRPTVTDTIQLVQDQNKRPGFLIFLPVYKKHSDVSSETLRIQNFSHWIYSPVIAPDFFKSIAHNFNDIVHLEIYDGDPNSKAELLYEDAFENLNPNYQPIENQLKLGEKTFYFKWQVTRKLIAESDFISTWIGFIGAFSVLFVSVFIVSLLGIKEKAQAIALKLNKDFMASEEKLRLQDAKIAESAKMASLGEMAGGIAHEINNPLAIISATIMQLDRLLKKSEAFSEKDKVSSYVSRLNGTVERISKIIKNLRHFARDGENDPMTSVPLNRIIEDTLSLCAERFKNAEIPVDLNLSYTGNIECREIQISQVILNLLGNAFDAIENLPEKWVKIETSCSGNDIILRITDSGHGIPMAVQNKMLNPFFTTKEVGKGTGLGLSISKGIIESHAGRLSVDNAVSNTAFVIQLPVRQRDSQGLGHTAA